MRYAARQFVSDYETGAEDSKAMADTSYERAQGKVKFFNTVKGFGFATRDGQGDVFIHANALKRSGLQADLKEGELLEFDVVPVEGKGPKADNIVRVFANKP